MANRWEIEDNEAWRTERNDWRVPKNDLEHAEETVPPGDLMIDPQKLELVPTLAPTESGIQHGQWHWSDENQPSDTWYIHGEIIQDDD